MRWRQATMGISVWLVVPLCLLGTSGATRNGFDLSQHTIPLVEIHRGGPPRDGIPAILHPAFVSAKEATFLRADERVLGVVYGSDARAYPVKILNWHEVVNDTVGGKAIVITYCPLCGSGIGFSRVMKGQQHTFGVSGLLYQSDMLMYDHQTESLWSQIAMKAVAGSMTGHQLEHVFLQHTTWEEWLRDHPKTKVLSTQTGHRRNYNRNPYLGYAERKDLMFPVNHENHLYHPKEWVVGLEVDGVTKAYPFSELKKAPRQMMDQVNERKIMLEFNAKSQTAVITDSQGRPVPSVMAYWFAWYAFHPDTLVFTHQKTPSDAP